MVFSPQFELLMCRTRGLLDFEVEAKGNGVWGGEERSWSRKASARYSGKVSADRQIADASLTSGLGLGRIYSRHAES